MIIPYGRLTHLDNNYRSIVLACGCFDVLTVGHVRHLQAARRLGAMLCVLITADKYVAKGPDRPIFAQQLRAEVVDALGCVDYTIINLYPTAEDAILTLRPLVYAKGREYLLNSTEQLCSEIEALRRVGGRIEYTLDSEWHTTDVLAQLHNTKEHAHGR